MPPINKISKKFNLYGGKEKNDTKESLLAERRVLSGKRGKVWKKCEPKLSFI
jgi:hypothetical protein